MTKILTVVLLAIALALGFAQQRRPADSAGEGNKEHGRYIAENVAMCIQCHTPREAGGELIMSRAFGGAPIPVGKPAQLNLWAEYAPRIAGLPQYSQEQMIRLLTTGIGREGKPLRAPMPAFRFTAQDAADVVAFLKSLE